MEDIHRPDFRTYNGHFEFQFLLFSLSNAPTTFQDIMNALFRAHLHKFIIVFFDDILIYNTTWEDHLLHLQITFELLSPNLFYLKLSKCSFVLQQVKYLKHVVSVISVGPDVAKIEARFSLLESIERILRSNEVLSQIHQWLCFFGLASQKFALKGCLSLIS